MKKVLSLLAVVTLLASLFTFGVSAAKPVEGDITDIWEAPMIEIETVDAGQKVVFAQGYSVGDRVAFAKTVDLDGLSITLKEVTNANKGIILYFANEEGAGPDEVAMTVIIGIDGEGKVLVHPRPDAEPYKSIETVVNEEIFTYSSPYDVTLSFAKKDTGWVLKVGDGEIAVPAALIELVEDTSAAYVSLGTWSWAASDVETSLIIADINNDGETPDPGTDDTTAAPAPGETTAKPSTPATGESTAVFAVVAVLVVSAVVLVASKRRSVK